MEKILTALGFAPVLTVDPQDLKAMKAAVDQAVSALDAGQQPAIVTRRPCLLIKRDKFRKGMCHVNADKCRGCRSCLRVGCPRHLHGKRQGRHRPHPVRGLHRLRPGLPLRRHRKGGKLICPT